LSVGDKTQEKFYSPAVSAEQVRAFEASSPLAQHLLEDARSDVRWKGPTPAPDVFLDPSTLRQLEFPSGAEFASAKVIRLAQSAACLGDLDGDGYTDIAIDTPSFADEVLVPRRLRILFLDAAANVRAQRVLESKDGATAAWSYANTLAALGDLDGNGTTDLVAGKENWASPATKDPAFSDQHGALWLLLLGPGGRVERSVDIGSSPALAKLGVSAGSGFGVSLAALGDLDGDGTLELAVGQDPDSDFKGEHGTAVFLLSLQRDGSVLRASRIEASMIDSAETGGAFGEALACVGDIDGDGVNDLAVADMMDDDGGSLRGAVWILFLTRSGSVRAAQKISDWEGGFEGLLRDYAFFGRSLAGVGDLDGNGVPDLLVGSDQGLWTLLLDSSGRVLAHRKLEETRRGDASVAYSRFICVLPGRHADLSREFLCGGDTGVLGPNKLSLWSLRVGPDGAVRAR
jgi:hypothetical protein